MNSHTTIANGSVPEARDDADRIARVALTLLIEPGDPAVWSIVQQVGAAKALQQVLDGDLTHLSWRAAMSVTAARDGIRAAAYEALRLTRQIGSRLLIPGDDEWPAQVNDLAQLEAGKGGSGAQNTAPPLCLWVRGDRSLSEAFTRSVAIVGARDSTSYGIHISTDVAHELAGHGWTIVAGGAFGVDAAAHRGALAAGGPTVAVLGCGIDRCYPAGHAALFDEITTHGLLVSQWPPGAEPLRHRFTIRNSLIATTGGTVLVEAAARSGAVPMMRRVLQLGRPAMVVPGPVTSAMSTGCHRILRAHAEARVVTSANDVMSELNRPGT